MRRLTYFWLILLIVFFVAALFFIVGQVFAQNDPPTPPDVSFGSCVPGYHVLFGINTPIVCNVTIRDRNVEGLRPIGSAVQFEATPDLGIVPTGTVAATVVGYQFASYPPGYTDNRPILYIVAFTGDPNKSEIGLTPDRIR